MSNPFRLSLTIAPPRRRSSSGSLHLARSGGRSSAGTGSASGSESGPAGPSSGSAIDDEPASAGGGGGLRRPPGLSFTPITPIHAKEKDKEYELAYEYELEDEYDDELGEDKAAAKTKVKDTAADDDEELDGDDVAAHEDVSLLSPTERRSARSAPQSPVELTHARSRSLSHSRVQFVDVLDAEAGTGAELDDLGVAAFEKPSGRELTYLVSSCVVLVLFALAAGLTTIFDWVL
jgi:hypothetical protein